MGFHLPLWCSKNQPVFILISNFLWAPCPNAEHVQCQTIAKGKMTELKTWLAMLSACKAFWYVVHTYVVLGYTLLSMLPSLWNWRQKCVKCIRRKALDSLNWSMYLCPFWPCNQEFQALCNNCWRDEFFPKLKMLKCTNIAKTKILHCFYSQFCFVFCSLKNVNHVESTRDKQFVTCWTWSIHWKVNKLCQAKRKFSGILMQCFSGNWALSE